MRILVTGSEGLIGRHLVALLLEEGEEVVPFDLALGHDVLDETALRGAAEGCDAIVHLAAIVDPDANPTDTLRVNLQGTANVLTAARAVDVRRVVYASSVNALGVFQGEAPPDYLPLDDDHACHPHSPYGISKLRAEELCEQFTVATGIATVCLRPPGVWEEATYARIHAARSQDPAFEWSPWWEYGAFLDVRDCATAFGRAILCADPGHVRLLLCAADISTSGATALELVERLLPGVEIRERESFAADPYRALVDVRRARRVLHWAPCHTWRDWIRESRP